MNNDNISLGETLDQLDHEVSLSTSHEMREKLEHFIVFLLEWNAFAHLVSKTDENYIVSRHIVDSLSLAPFVGTGTGADGDSHLDIGTGGGFPAIPLAITLPGTRFLAIERAVRKSTFLRKIVAELGLSNLQIVPGSFPESALEYSPASVSARAVENPERVYQSILEWLPPDCTFLCQFPGPQDELPQDFKSTMIDDRWTSEGYRRGSLRLIQRVE